MKCKNHENIAKINVLENNNTKIIYMGRTDITVLSERQMHIFSFQINESQHYFQAFISFLFSVPVNFTFFHKTWVQKA